MSKNLKLTLAQHRELSARLRAIELQLAVVVDLACGNVKDALLDKLIRLAHSDKLRDQIVSALAYQYQKDFPEERVLYVGDRPAAPTPAESGNSVWVPDDPDIPDGTVSVTPPHVFTGARP